MSAHIGEIKLVDDVVTHVSASRAGVEVLTEARLTCDPISARNYAALLVRAADEVRVDHDSVKRGGTCRVAVCVCGWVGPQRSSLEIAVDDAHAHEGRPS